jgi:xanthine dehydrogenase accessory factor
VRRDASIIGTIGGGLLEAQVQRIAMEVLGDGKPVFRKFSFTAKEAAQMAMICGGEVEVLVYFVDALDASNVVIYQQINEALRLRKRAWLITGIPQGCRTAAPLQADGMGGAIPRVLPGSPDCGPETPAGGAAAQLQCLVKSDGTLVGQLDDRIAQALAPYPAKAELVSHESNLFFVEPLCNEGTVFIFGAGHVSQKLAPLTAMVGFQTVVLDDRREFANRERFETADDVIVPSSFERAMDGLEINEQSYLVLVTRGHAHDKTLLRQALGTKAGYIGMIGSRRKRDAVYEALRKEGFSPHDFDRVFSPIGLEIGAETPEEIAVSILAELIRVRAEKNQ